MLRNIGIIGAVVVATLSVAGSSAAQEKTRFGESGTLILGAERVSPLIAHSRNKSSFDLNGVETSSTATTTSMSLLWSGAQSTIHNIPRIAFDFAVAPNFTVGGSVYAYFTLSAKDKSQTGPNAQEEDRAKTTVFGIAPRLGYIVNITDSFAFWPRAGFSYTHVRTAGEPETQGGITIESSTTQSHLAVHIEPMFVVMPAPHFGISIGPVADIPVSGTIKSERTTGGTTTSTEGDLSQLHIGLTAGILGYF